MSTNTIICWCTNSNRKKNKLHICTSSHIRHVQIHRELVRAIRKSSRIYTSPCCLIPEIVEHTSTILLVVNLKILLTRCLLEVTSILYDPTRRELVGWNLEEVLVICFCHTTDEQHQHCNKSKLFHLVFVLSYYYSCLLFCFPLQTTKP